MRWTRRSSLLALGLVALGAGWSVRSFRAGKAAPLLPTTATTPAETPRAAVEAPPPLPAGPLGERHPASELELARAREPADAAPVAAPLPDVALVRVRVVAAETGEPLARVRLFLATDEPEAVNEGALDPVPLTDARGEAEFRLPSGQGGTVSLHFTEETLGPATTSFSGLAPGEELELVLRPATQHSLHYCGVVLREEDGVAVPDARLRGWGPNWPSASTDEHGEIAVGADGTFELDLAAWAPPLIAIRAPGRGAVRVRAEAGHETPATACVISMPAAASLRAQVTGLPAELGSSQGAELRASASVESLTEEVPSFRGRWTGETWTSELGPGGTALLEGLVPRVDIDLRLQVGRATRWKAPEPLRLEPGEVRELTIRLGTGAAIDGRLVDPTGGQVARTRVWLVLGVPGARPQRFSTHEEPYAEARTDEQGRFRFEEVGPGTWLVGPRPYEDSLRDVPSPDRLAPVGQPVEMPEPPVNVGVEVRVERGLYIVGRVLTPDGAPAEDASILALRAGLFAGADSGAEGAFWLGPLTDEPYLVSASQDGYADSEATPVSPGGEAVVLVLREGGRLSGVVVDGPTGEPVAAQLSSSLGDSLQQMGVQGEFDLTHLGPGSWTLFARTEDGRVGLLSNLPLHEGEHIEHLQLAVAPGVRLKLDYRGEAPSAMVTFEVADDLVGIARLQRGVTWDGTFPPGPLSLQLYRGQPRPDPPVVVELVAGEDSALTLP